ncbi:S8 family serine peptidase [Cohnella sp. AR92]|uniref:S8 family serine peptidase n=1 Tax=Cohnella sp. AR92 TaxID=648716 RepID=UPI001315281A|nr:S8 family serine peptidase [Cohnella sp. AR92]
MVPASPIAPTVHAASKSDSKQSSKYIVGLKKDVATDSFISKKGFDHRKVRKGRGSNTLMLSLDPDEVSNLKKDSSVRFVEPDAKVSVASIDSVTLTNDSELEEHQPSAETMPWGVHAIGADLADSQHLNGIGIKVAVLDTGISRHEDLNVRGGVTFVPDTESYYDDNGHGTHVAGIIGAQENNIGIVGVAPKVELYAVKVLDSMGTGSYSQVIQGIDWAVEHDMDILSMSIGGEVDSQALHEAITSAMNHGVIVIAAAGNKGAGEESEIYPALYPGVVSVGAVDQSLQKANFSSTGSELDLMAPGMSIRSTNFNGGYSSLSGTSMAVPFATGAAALLWSANKEWTAEHIIQQLYETATPLGAAHEYGHGLINVAKALQLINGPVELDVMSSPNDPNASFDVNEQDARLLELSNQLDALYRKAYQSDDQALAKKIKTQYYELYRQNVNLHQVTMVNSSLSKEERSVQLQSQIAAFENRSEEFKKLEEAYQQAITIALNAVLPEGSITNTNYKTGDGQVVQAGQEAKVSIAWVQVPSKVDIQVSNLDTQSIVSLDTYYPDDLFMTYTWSTLDTTSPGHYQIRLSYPDGPVDFDDFSIEVTEPVTQVPVEQEPVPVEQEPVPVEQEPVPVEQEPVPVEQEPVPVEQEPVPVEQEPVPVEQEPVPVEQEPVPVEQEPVIVEQEPVPVVDEPLMSIQATTLTLNSAVDVNLAEGVTQIYAFTPSATDKYKFFTGPYGGTGAENDTVLELFSDANLTNLIDSNDDANSTLFSEIGTTLTAGVTVYLRLSGYGLGAVHARLTVKNFITTITVGSSTNVSSASAYKFVPTTSGFYRFYTSYYGGSSSAGVNDTYLTLYSDNNLTQFIDYNDDAYNGNSFSEISSYLIAGVPYYIQIDNYFDVVHARLQIAAVTLDSLSLNSAVNLDSSTGLLKMYSFTPTTTDTFKFVTGPYGGTGDDNDTLIELYSDPQLTNLIAANDEGLISYFSELDIQLTQGVTVYVKIRTPVGDLLHSRFAINLYTPALTTSTPVNADSRTSGSTIYKFTAPSTGVYKFTTSYYGGSTSAGLNDTLLGAYSDIDLINWIDNNDNFNNSVFSQVVISVTAGTSIYLQVQSLDSKGVHARLSATALSTSTLSISTTPDISTSDVKLYKITPTSTGTYRINTTYYGGLDTNQENDTVISVYSDASFQTLLPYGYNDDSNGMLFSEVLVYLTANTSYYLKVSGYDNAPLYTRLKIAQTAAPLSWIDTPTSNQSISKLFTLSGWILDGAGVNKVEVLIDGTVQGEAQYGLSREDVFNAYPAYNNHNSGFQYPLNTTLLTNGTHTLTIRETSIIGISTIVATKSFSISNTLDGSLPTVSSLSASGAVQANSGSFDLYAYGVADIGAGVANVEFITWSEFNGQDDIKTVKGKNMGSGTWKATIPLDQHNNERGNYITHVYVSDYSGYRVLVGQVTSKVYLNGIDYRYDAAGRLISLIPALNKEYKFTYDKNGNMLKSQYYDYSNDTSGLSGYSTTQGKNNWYYQEWDGTTFTNLTWDSLNGLWRNSSSSTEISSDSQLPGTKNSVRKWIVSTVGTVTISGNVAKSDITGGDGVNVKIMKNSTQIWPASGWQYIAYNNNSGINVNVKTTVAAGDAIYFIVDKNANNSNDSTKWNPVISYDFI